MNAEIIKDEIKWLLEAINEQYEAIHRHGGRIPQIEFDILMENVRKFYESMQLLQRVNNPLLYPERTSKPATVPEPVQVTRNIEPKAENTNPPPAPVTVQFKPSQPPAARQEAASASKKAAKVQEIDLFAMEEPAFSIKLKDARERTLGPKIPSERIENLKTAISINEKFILINELFDGNLREYNETIETLNGFKTLEQAADYLDLMRKKNFWNTGSNPFKKLKELVERRF
ncbi:MAG: hypothetical protein ACOYNC_04050 [Bacteroidales bacterium]